MTLHDDDLRPVAIEESLRGQPWGRPLQVVEEIDSTNAALMREAAALPEGALLLADRQTAGRGRSGRHWINPAGENIAMSWLLRPDLRPVDLPSVVMPISVGVARALRALSGAELKIKWPNDIVFQNRKLCGILCESRMMGLKVDALVVGVGVNVNTAAFAEEIESSATSLLAITGRKTPRERIPALLLAHCHRCYEDYFSGDDGRREAVWRDYCEMSATLGRRVVLSDGEKRTDGVAETIDRNGLLHLRGEDGMLTPFVAGEVSLRPRE